MATKEELMAQGFDAETAALLAEASAAGTGGSLPFPVMKFSYDNEDVLIEDGVKKGNFITGYQIDKKTLTIKEKGTDHGNALEFMVVASVFQNTHFDTQTGSTDVATDIFYSSFESPKTVDKKSGLTVKELKDSGVKVKFTNILLLLVKEGEDWKPYINYCHGTNYHNLYAQLEESGIKTITLGHTFKVKSKKVPTNFQPAWVFDIQKATPRTPEEVVDSVPVVSAAMKEFNTWVKATNAGEVTKPSAIPTTPAPAGEDIVVDINEADIPF